MTAQPDCAALSLKEQLAYIIYIGSAIQRWPSSYPPLWDWPQCGAASGCCLAWAE